MSKLVINNLDLYYGEFHALKDVNLDIEEKEITAFIGPSGCGKSTLLKSINRMNDLVKNCKITGDITLEGEDVYRQLDINQLRKKVGMVFQKPNPFPMSIYDNVAFGPRTHSIHSKAELDDIVERSLKQAAYGMRLKIVFTNLLWVCLADSSNVCVLRVLLLLSLMFYLWMNPQVPWILFQQQKLKNWLSN